jgi:S-adenosylmethionine/arginine decarboxylase-like enzyme
VFENTVQVQFENVPKICDQAFVLASNRIDFLSRNLTGHDTENNLYIEPFDAESDPFDLVHDYRRNHDSGYKKLCKNDHEDDGGVLEQEGSPGIFMAVEAEEVTMELQSMKDVQAAVTKALEQEGLKVDSVAESQAGSAPAETVLVLREGYVAIRTWPEQKYCAFDIHLWSSFEKHEAAKKAVVASVGGMIENASSYRIVAGGMFGVSTWKDDAKVHGPQMDKLCDRSDAPGRDAPIDSNTVEVAIEAGVRLIRDEHPIIAAVVCGKSEECPTVALLEKNDKVEKVIVLSRCSYLMPDDEDLGQGLERIIACEREILQILNDSLTDGKLLGVVVVDGGATHLMGQIVLKILTDSTISHTRTLFSPELIAIATIDDEETESWKRNFLDEVRRDVVRLDPVFRIEILLNTTDSSMELGITASGDDHFIQHLTDTFASVQNESGLSVEIRRFHGGLWRTSTKVLMDDSEADHLYSHESYNRTAPMEQWRSQTPLAHQSLLQFETRPLRVGDNVVVTFADEDDDEDDEMFQGIVEWVNDDNTYFVKFDEGDVFDAVERIDIRKLYGSPNDQMLTATQVKNALKNALSSMPYRMMAEQADVEELASAGDGSVLSAFWSGGSMLLMWDGRTHFDINLITYFESSRLGEDLVIKLKEEISGLETILLDEHPRGSGRVVNFKKDLESMDPYWA